MSSPSTSNDAEPPLQMVTPSNPTPLVLDQQLQELELIQCSLLPGELFTFILSPEDAGTWASLLDSRSSIGGTHLDGGSHGTEPPCQARFQVRVSGAHIWFEVELPSSKHTTSTTQARVTISVKGENISRGAQERWQATVREKMLEVGNSEFPVYELLCLHLLPMLHEEVSSGSTRVPHSTEPEVTDARRYYHALLTSHHLVSPTKRRLMQQWSSDLGITGFTKVGYPGIIYAEGQQERVEEFVANVKAMQWLALRVRFIEPAEPNNSVGSRSDQWLELQKIGEVLEQMRKRDRESHITDLGIGNSSKQ